MFNIESKINKYGQKAFERKAYDEKYYTSRDKKFEKMSFSMVIPKYKTNIQLIMYPIRWTQQEKGIA